MRILLVKTSSLGDVVHNLPVVSDIVRRFPDAVIDWVVEESFADIPRLHPAVRRVIPVAVRRWRRGLWSPTTWRQMGEFRRQLQADEYDLVLDTQGLLKSALIAQQARLTANGRRCGHDADSAREPVAARFHDHHYPIAKNQHAVERNRQLVAAALNTGVALPLEYGIAAPPLVAPWLPKSDYAVLLTATSRTDKEWPEPDWQALGMALIATGMRCILPAGSADERARALRLVSSLGRALAAPPMTLAELASLLSGAALVVGVDTGLVHLAVALGRPTLALYCGSDPALTGVYADARCVNLGGRGTPPGARGRRPGPAPAGVMARFLYTLALLVLVPWALLHLLWRSRRQPEYLKHWSERFGFFGARPDRPLIWIHAVSVGETRAAQPLVAALRERYPGHRILFTHMTPTGRQTSTDLFGDAVTRVYLPYDTPWAVRRFLDHFRPQLGLIMETELWPNLIHACHRRNQPLLLINARLSERSAARYAHLPTLTREALRSLAAIAAQGEDDARRLSELGAAKVEILGNMKFDVEPPAPQLALGREFRARIGDRRVFLCASTREGEEALILDSWQRMGYPEILLVIVPRHPQRFDEVAALITARGLTMQRRSDGTAVAAATQVWLGDSMGELFAYYVASDAAFIGGSLLDHGSQNLIEPCAVGVPVLVGPSTYNFADAARAALAQHAAISIAGADELIDEALVLLGDPPRRAATSKAASEFASHHRGATARTLALLEPYLR